MSPLFKIGQTFPAVRFIFFALLHSAKKDATSIRAAVSIEREILQIIINCQLSIVN